VIHLKNFLNSIFRGFGYSIGKFIFWGLLALLGAWLGGFLTITNVFASTNTDWGYNISQPKETFILDSGNNSKLLTLTGNYSQTNTDLTNAWLRVFVNTGNRFKANYLYNISFYYCGSRSVTSLTSNTMKFATSTNSFVSQTYSTNGYHVLTKPFTNISGLNETAVSRMNYCFESVSLGVPSSNADYLVLDVNGNSRFGYFTLVGVEVKELGLYDGIIKTIVENSVSNGSNNVINNQNSNKQEIINNQNSNNQAIISNANSNQQKTDSYYTDDTENEDGTCNGIICNLKKTVKGIINLPKTFLEAIINALKSLFIPSNDFFMNWINELMKSFEEQLGFLAYPITFTIDVLNRFYNISVSDPIIIIPPFSDPFYNVVIFNGATWNLNDYVQNGALKTLYLLGYTFINAYIIVNFIEFCRNKVSGVMGSRVEPYEFTTVETVETNTQNNYDGFTKKGTTQSHSSKTRTTTGKRG